MYVHIHYLQCDRGILLHGALVIADTVLNFCDILMFSGCDAVKTAERLHVGGW